MFITISLFSSELEKIKLQLQWKHQFEFAGFYMAKEKGFYKDVGLDVSFIEYKEGMDITQEVVSRNADYGLSFSSIILDYLNDKPIIMLANFFKQSPLVLLTQKNIRTPADLKDKKIMGLLDSTHKRTVLDMLGKFDISSNDFINIPREFSLHAFLDKKVDAISVFTTNEIYTLSQLGIKYNILDPAVFGTKFYDLNLFTTKDEVKNNPLKVQKFKEASIKGWEYALKNKKETISLILHKYNTQKKSKEALLFEAKQIEYLMLTNIYPIGSIDLQRLKTISDSFTQSLGAPKASTDTLRKFMFQEQESNFDFTPKEIEYLAKKRELRMCVDPNWMPFEKIESGKYIGIAADYMKIISQKINTPFKLVPTKNWTQSLEKLKNNKCDFFPLAQKTSQRENFLLFTQPYITSPIVLASKKGVVFSSNFEDFKNKTLGVVKNYPLYEVLKKKYPYLNLVQTSSVEEGLFYVDQEKIFGFLDNSLVINTIIQKNKMQDSITISGQFQENYDLSVASRVDEPILNAIFEKALLNIDKKKKEEIFTKWNNINYQVKIDYKFTAFIVFFTIFLLGISIYWNLKLKEQIKAKELTQKKLEESEDKFRILFDEAPVLLNAFDANQKVLFWNKECEKVFGYSLKELEKSSDILNLFYPDIKEKEKVINSFHDEHYNVYKEWKPQSRDGKLLTTVWANIKLPSGDVFNIGYDRTKQKEAESIIQEKTKALEKAKNELEKLNDSLEKTVKKEIAKNIKQELILMHQSKLAQMGEMIENIAHQWRQPLAQINSSVLVLDTFLTKYNIEDRNIEDKLLQIESLTEYMSKTIDDFKNFFNPDKNKEHFKVLDAVENSCDILKGRLRILDIKVTLDIEDTLKCYSHKNELQQVMLILLNNAIDVLEIRKIKEKKIKIVAKISHEYISITIEDNALGIDATIVDKIFEPYFTTKYKSQGTGLGLYMAKKIVENALNGSIDMNNKKSGACFIVKMPQGEKYE